MDARELSGMGRNQLETMLLGTQAQLTKLQAECAEATRVMDQKDWTIRSRDRQITDLQNDNTKKLVEVRDLKRETEGLRLMLEMHPFADLVAALKRGREKYPQGCTMLSLVDEVGEVARVRNKEKGDLDRWRAELMDLIVVAWRLRNGEECPERADGQPWPKVERVVVSGQTGP